MVDITNYLSLLHLVPMGGDDLTPVEGDIVLRFARGDEPFSPLGSGERQTARQGEVIYADDKDVLCRRWNWRESEKTKMTDATRDVLLVAEGLPPVTEGNIRGIVHDLRDRIRAHCGGEIETGVLTAAHNEWEL